MRNRSSFGNGEEVKSLRKVFSIAGFGLLALLAASFTLAAVIVVFEIPRGLSYFRPRIEALATQAIGRPVRLSGEVRLTPALRPAVELNRVQVNNPPGWKDAPFLSIDSVRGEIDLKALLHGNLVFLVYCAMDHDFAYVSMSCDCPRQCMRTVQ